MYRSSIATILPGEEDFGIVPVEAQACGRPVVALGRGGALETVMTARPACSCRTVSVEALADGLRAPRPRAWDAARIRQHAERFSRDGSCARSRVPLTRRWPPRRTAMVKRHNRLLVAFHVVTDALLGMVAFILAYFVRFETGLIPVTKGQPPLEQYLDILPFIAVIVPLGFHLQGLYRLRRGRSRIDDFFNVLVGSIIAVVSAWSARCTSRRYYVARRADRNAAPTRCRSSVWGIFLALQHRAGYLSRKFVREALERRWIAGVGLRRILIAGAGDLGRMVADKILEHRELGYQIVGFVDDRAGGDHLGYRGLPLLGALSEAAEIVAREKVDHLYVALPLEEHMKLLDLVESTSREGVDVKVVPDLLQFIALRARLEDLDGVPVINLNDVPLQGLNAAVKRALDIAISACALA